MNRKHFFAGLAWLTIGACNIITNNNNDFSISGSGIRLDTGPDVITPGDEFKTIRWLRDGSTVTAVLSGHENLDGDFGLTITGDEFLHLRTTEGDIRLNVPATGSIILDLPSDEVGILSADESATTSGSESGFILVQINGINRRIKTFQNS